MEVGRSPSRFVAELRRALAAELAQELALALRVAVLIAAELKPHEIKQQLGLADEQFTRLRKLVQRAVEADPNLSSFRVEADQ